MSADMLRHLTYCRIIIIIVINYQCQDTQ